MGAMIGIWSGVWIMRKMWKDDDSYWKKSIETRESWILEKRTKNIALIFYLKLLVKGGALALIVMLLKLFSDYIK